MKKLASINETLQLEIQVLCQQLKEGGETSVVSIKGRVRKK